MRDEVKGSVERGLDYAAEDSPDSGLTSRVHIMSWCPQDWLSSPLRGELAMERNHLARVVYRDLLDVLHERGGYLNRGAVAGACLVTPEEAEAALKRLLESKRIQITEDGRLYNERVLEALEEQRKYREQRALLGSAGGKRRAERTTQEERTETAKRAADARWKPEESLNECLANAKRMHSLPSPIPIPTPKVEPCLPSVDCVVNSTQAFDISLSPKSENPDREAYNPIAAVLAHYRTYHPRAIPKPRPTSLEWRRVRERLAEGFTVADLCAAIDGNHRSPFHCGENDGGRQYNDLSLILRSGDTVRRFIETPSPDAPVLSERTRRNFRAAKNWAEHGLAGVDGAAEPKRLPEPKPKPLPDWEPL